MYSSLFWLATVLLLYLSVCTTEPAPGSFALFSGPGTSLTLPVLPPEFQAYYELVERILDIRLTSEQRACLLVFVDGAIVRTAPSPATTLARGHKA